MKKVKPQRLSRRSPANRHSYSKRPVIGIRNIAGLAEYIDAFSRYSGYPEDAAEPPGLAVAISGESTAAASDAELFLRRLYILEPADLSDFTLDDLLLAWEHRKQVCGSVDAAAELFALYRVAAGLDEDYQGAESLIQAPEVVAILQETPQQSHDSPPRLPMQEASEPSPGLTVAEVRALSMSDLSRAWGDRPDSFASLEAAAEALATLRWFSAADSEQKPLTHYLKHPLILEMEDDLPRELAPMPEAKPERELDLLRQDRRETKVQVSVVRTGQRDFRDEVFSRYGGRCCVTGCTIARLLEAAHIIPHRGSQTDHAENGLLLRVDLHRLFDEHLISIEPATLTLIVSEAIDDTTYRSLHSTPMFRLTPKPRRLYLEDHYRRYMEAERQRRD